MRRTLLDDEHDSSARFRASWRPRWSPTSPSGSEAGIVDRRDVRAGGGRFPRDGGARALRRRAAVDDFRFNVVVAEEVRAAGLDGVGLGLTLHNDVCLPYLLSYATDGAARPLAAGHRAAATHPAIAMTEPGIGSDLAAISTTRVRDGDELHRQRGQDLHHQRDQRRPGHRRRQDRSRRKRHRGHQPAGGGARHGGLRARAATWTRSASTPRTPPSCSSPSAGAGRQPAGRGGAGLPLPGHQPRPRSASRSRSAGWPRPGLPSTGRSSYVRRAQGVRQAGRLVPEHPLPAGRAGHRDRVGQAYIDRACVALNAGELTRRGGGRGQVVVHRGAEPGGRPLRAAARRLRLHDRVPHRPGLGRRAGHHASTVARPRS